jgi:probable HAF family extracellular repeat protein
LIRTGATGECSRMALKISIYSTGTMTDLGTLYGYHSVGMAINDAGQVTGYSFVPYVGEHAFLYSNGTMTRGCLPFR